MYIDVMTVKPRAYIFGAGHVGCALAKTLLGTPFDVHLIDSREMFIDAGEIPADIVKHKGDPLDIAHNTDWGKIASYIIIMTHSHALDEDLVKVLLKKPSTYMGLIGSRTKWAKFQQNLQKAGFTETDWARVHCPIGLALGGGKAPQEIAISVAAELVKLYYNAYNDRAKKGEQQV